MHPSDGTLRRSLDEPVALDPRTRRHLATCSRCAQRLAAIETDVAGAFAVFAAPDPSIDLKAARVRLAQTEATTPSKSAPGGQFPRLPRGSRGARLSRVMAGIAVAALASVLLVVSGGAQDFLSLFQPKQFAAVPVTSADIRSLAGLASYGYISGGSTPLSIEPEADATAAARAAGLAPLTVRDLPAGTTAAASYAVVSGTVVSFTFDAGLARAAASRAGGQLPAMPQGLDGSTLTVAIAPAVVISYGLDLATLYQGGALPAGGSDVIVVASRTPTVSSTGVTAQQLESYLLSLPGIPAGVAAEIRAIGDPAQTVPVPIPVSLASASIVDVNGARGLLIGDSTQLGSVVLWQHNGVVYAVAGTLSSDQVLGIARSLH